MRIALIADIHRNLEALEAVLRDVGQRPVGACVARGLLSTISGI